jgi:hypothetical protein
MLATWQRVNYNFSDPSRNFPLEWSDRGIPGRFSFEPAVRGPTFPPTSTSASSLFNFVQVNLDVLVVASLYILRLIYLFSFCDSPAWLP